MKKLSVIIRPSRRDETIRLFESCAVYGIMITDIYGYGTQKGFVTMYRGVSSGPNMLMKLLLETVGDDETIETLRKLLVDKLKTGNIGDGKIFVEKVRDAIRIRTGERGEKAM